MNEYEVFAVTIVADCPDCSLAVPIQNMENRSNCPHCKKSFVCDWTKRGRFETALINQLERAIETKKVISTDTVLSVSVEVMNELPCENCKMPLTIAESTTGFLTCNHCKAQNNIKQAEPINGIDFIVNGFNPDINPLSVADYSVSCISCGGDVPIKNLGRTQVCSFCQRETIVPDELWQKIHPEGFVKPFYLALHNLASTEVDAKKTTDETRLAVLANHFYYKVRVGVAENPSLTQNIARELMADSNGIVVNTLKKHPKFGNWFEVNLFSDKKEAKEYSMSFPHETNPNLTEAEMMELARQRMPKRLIALVYNPAITPEVMKQIIKQKIETAAIALAKRLDLDSDILKLLVNCNYPVVNRILASNNSLQLSSIMLLSVSNDKTILNGLLKNSNVPQDIKLKVEDRLSRL